MNTSTTTVAQAPVAAIRRPRLLAFEIQVEGHHPGYVRQFARLWANHRIAADLDFVVTPEFFHRHPDAVDEVKMYAAAGINIHPLSEADYRKLEQVPYLRYFAGWKLYCKYARQLDADHGLLMYWDFFQLPSIVGPPSPCPYSAIYFRPTFHYHTLKHYSPSLKEWFRATRKRLMLQQVLKDKQLDSLLCLDEIAADYIRDNMATHAKISHMADSFPQHPECLTRVDELRRELGVDPHRRVFCLMGVLDRRKGPLQLLQSLEYVSREAGQKICILLVGRVLDTLKAPLQQQITKLRANHSVQVILHDDFVPDADVQHYYLLADVVLATYQNHMGSSHALVRAAYAGRPVLSSNYGLIGELVTRRQLGQTVDTTDGKSLAAAIQSLASCDLSGLVDLQEARRFAGENSQERVAEVLAALVSA